MKQGGRTYSRIRMLLQSIPKARFAQPSRVTAGFTIVETLIVLAVTGLLAVSAMLVIGGRQNKTEFQTAINNLQQQIQQVINETASGYFPGNNSFTCTVAGAGKPNISPGTGAGQGTNGDCVFLGKVMQFGIPGTDPETFAVHSIAGNRTATTLAAAEPVDIYNPNVQDVLVTQKLENGLTVDHMIYTDTAGGNGDTSGIAFLAGDSNGNIGATNGTGAAASGAQQISLYRVKATKVQISSVNDMASKINAASPNFVSASQVSICVASGTTDQSGLITIGGGQQRLSVTLAIKAGQVC